MRRLLLITSISFVSLVQIVAQINVPQPVTLKRAQISYSDMDSWWSRHVTESRLIGGSEVIYFEPGPDDERYQKIEGTIEHLTPWATSNVKAEVGVRAANQSVFREKRGDGYCARLETNLKKVVVLGIVNVKAIASGSIFTGSMVDPITDPNNPRHNTLMGIPFNEAPSALSFDYKLIAGQQRLQATGGFSVKKIAGADKSEVYMLLQSRKENPDGSLTVKRVGTAWQRFEQSKMQWINNYQIPVVYGDASQQPGFKPYMNLITDADPYYAINSKGQKVGYVESGWSNNADDITHIIIVFSASYEGGAYIGSPESKLWIDNIQLIYD
ncbi:PCMD domain-containing protein [Carboxylicivirga mesophila]|uniref:PCMD domain-containing protein n=1 Tax=Carboxylicivirga mesophila TaxID=1166478 RepID=A0ABS5K5W1_9BACT|nr:PCMD domain-containing protein [Carboxylicivirga mesophila]MBS2210337.1 PCMD domain-containing protein [Carboxylicivirga mesophila]